MLPVPPLVELTVPVVLVAAVAVTEVTSTVTVQLAPAARLTPLIPVEPPPAAPPASVPPVQVVDKLGAAEFTRVPPYVSLNATPASALATLGLRLLKVMSNCSVPPMAVALGVKLLAITGASNTRVCAVAGALSVVVSVVSMMVVPIWAIALLVYSPAVPGIEA